ncbi:DNA phosphorothioation-associated protein 4 [Streptomyces sp. UH6]|uniref:DNA phosphorothioation-associated protein 4 n=1 Tax=Streptomyces sp. UH6 TaxID=2748379 RepID=UPI0015D52190|nr:DNA phosphorothioation-associated protein 4 [Streptomyces sp. UH6]NYV73206.1 DNA phosphorothioation-associated protein 4 [Streptomyces sp. UH6]
MPSTDRFRRPSAHEKLLSQLTDKNTGPFVTMVEAMMFAALLGHRKSGRESFTDSDEPIRLSVMEGRPYGDVLLDVLAAVEHDDDPKILGDEHQADRVLIFEEYANGGLSYLQTLISRQSAKSLQAIVSDLVLDGLQENPVVEDEVGEFLASADLDW